jgi:PAS domain S-box-containing protein
VAAPADPHPSYALFGLILETALDAVVVVDTDGVVVGWNGVAEATFGWTRDEASGRPLNELIIPDRYKAAHRSGFERFLATGQAHVLGQRIEIPALRKDGEEIPVELSIAEADFGHGQVFIGYLRDISERRAAEQAARQQSSILAQLTEGVIIADASGKLTFVNDAAARLHGVAELGVTPDRYSDTYHLYTLDGRLFPPHELPLARALRGETVDEGRWRIHRPDGTAVLAVGNAQPIVDAQGNQVAAVVTVRDETAREAAEQQVRESEARLRTLTDNLPSGMVYQISTGRDGSDRRFLFVSQSNERLTGVPAEEVMRDPMVAYNMIHPDDRARLVEAEAQAIRSRAPFDVEVRFHHANGEQRWCRILSAPREQGDGSLIWDGLQIDITDRKRAEETRAASESRLRALFEQAAAGIVQTDLTGRFVEANDHYCKMVGRSREELLQLRMQDITHPEDLGRNLPDFDSTAKAGGSFEIEKRYIRPDGADVWVRNSVSAVRGLDGEIEGILAVSVDITDRKLAEQALYDLNQSLERRVAERTAERNLLATLVETTDVMVMACDLEFNILAINSANADEFERIYGVRPAAGDNILRLLDDQPEHRAQVEAGWGPALRGEEYTIVDEFGDPDRDRPYYQISFRTLHDAEGRRIGAYHFVTDVTPRLKAEAKLLETQEALRQSQKMEAMGQLTGGVAHDFNNLLTPIVGALDLLVRRGLGSERERKLIAGALQSADRAATLVQRLLAFARRQPLKATAVDVRSLVAGMADLIESTLGPNVEVKVELDDNLPAANADPNQLEMALLNLAVNARDAMPDGGMLTILAARESIAADHHSKLSPGYYLRLSVEDTGVGMDAETAQRAIEPFFSTKGIGKGTGLGLSMVHGLAAQLGGAVTLRSAPGHGTTVDVWLPVSLATASDEPELQRAIPAPSEARGKVLLVDDEVLVRMSTADMLAELGYDVTEASSGEAALERLQAGETFDLLVTDQLMAGMSGIELAEEASELHPGMLILIASGYSERDSAASRWPRLTKPFRKSELAARLAELQPIARAD